MPTLGQIVQYKTPTGICPAIVTALAPTSLTVFGRESVLHRHGVTRGTGLNQWWELPGEFKADDSPSPPVGTIDIALMDADSARNAETVMSRVGGRSAIVIGIWPDGYFLVAERAIHNPVKVWGSVTRPPTAELLDETDPAVWAAAFVDRFREGVVGEIDAGLMLGWFANAMQARDSSIPQHRFTREELKKLLFQVARAATRPLLEDHPDYTFPSVRVGEAVRDLLSGLGYE